MLLPRPILPGLRASVLAVALCVAGRARAAEVAVTVNGGSVVVVVDGAVAGPAPLTRDLPPGRHELAFRASEFGANLFTQPVDVPSAGATDVVVDLTQMTASVRARVGAPTPAPPAAAPAAAPVAPAIPAAPVAAAPPPAPAPARPTGDLYVAASEPGARILIDGKPVDARSPTLLSGLSVGKHAVEARTDCARGKADVQVTAGTIARADLVLAGGHGALLVSSDPAAAQVLIDGAPAGVTPITVKDVTCGDHAVELRVLGYHPSTQSVHVPAFAVTPVQVVMEKERFGTLVVAPTPLEATVGLDGVDAGAGPRTFDKVAAGPHALRVALDGYDTDARTVDVVPDVVTRLDVALRPTVVAEAATSAPRSRLSIARLALNGGVTAGGLVLGAAAAATYAHASAAYQDWLAIPDDNNADAYWSAEVQPRKNAALLLAASSGVTLAGAAALWLTTDWSVGVGTDVVALRGSW